MNELSSSPKTIHKTAQRMAILDYIKKNKSHPSIMDIYHHISKKLSTISLTTVYNTMDLLKKEGLVFELPAFHGEGRRFDSDPVKHDHFICNSCGNVFDIDVDIDHSLLLSEEQTRSFDVEGTCISVYGTCPHCKNNSETKSN